ncbi:tripartite tricarboxylate transporter substrate binding protein [Bordetella sp. BOR01]|uniref:Bug family tripartite tricarboxylate transporter substrate binding protein n=1 Tax=Bordetella sp. BOR01 TaxID=2854779 RepID=UPI001C48A1A4|nr:tripartite tricarboxylate transporter substrate binding protein [Bordetella sp. BOR01]MBV7483214.1 tripartite tricarboxylate transporter substrate binding protein [Bordetella sp. BOR01]
MKFWTVILSVALAAASGQAIAASYPARAVRIVVPFAPGGIGDGAARLLATKLTEQTGQPFVVENRTGAGGRIGYDYVAKADNDGYTLVAIDTSYNMYPGLYAKLPWNIDEDLVGITRSSETPYALITSADSKMKTVGDLVAAAKAEPGKINYGSAGIGSANHAATHLFAQAAGIELSHVPYKGMGDALVGLYGGSVELMLTALPTAAGQLASGKITVLGVSSQARLQTFPDIPTIKEQGVDYVGGNWFGLAAPKGTPPEIIEFLHQQTVKALASADLRKSFETLGLQPVGDTPQAFNKLLHEQTRYWTDALRKANIQPQ